MAAVQEVLPTATVNAASRTPAAQPSSPSPSAHDVHLVIQRAAGSNDPQERGRTLRLFFGALRLGCVPLTATYGLVLRVALEAGGVPAAVHLLETLGTSVLSAQALFVLVGDLLLLQLPAMTGRPATTDAHTIPPETSASDAVTAAVPPPPPVTVLDALVELVEAAASRHLPLTPRHRLPVWQHMGRRGGYQAAILSLYNQMVPSDTTLEEATVLLAASAACGDWQSAEQLREEGCRDSSSSDSTMITPWLAQLWTLYLNAYARAFVTSCKKAASTEGQHYGIPWRSAVEAVYCRCPAAVRENAAVAAALHDLQTAGERHATISLRVADEASATEIARFGSNSAVCRRETVRIAQAMLRSLAGKLEDEAGRAMYLTSELTAGDDERRAVCVALLQSIAATHCGASSTVTARTTWAQVAVQLLTLPHAACLLHPLRFYFPDPHLPVLPAAVRRRGNAEGVPAPAVAEPQPLWLFLVEAILPCLGRCCSEGGVEEEEDAFRCQLAATLLAFVPGSPPGDDDAGSTIAQRWATVEAVFTALGPAPATPPTAVAGIRQLQTRALVSLWAATLRLSSPITHADSYRMVLLPKLLCPLTAARWTPEGVMTATCDACTALEVGPATAVGLFHVLTKSFLATAPTRAVLEAFLTRSPDLEATVQYATQQCVWDRNTEPLRTICVPRLLSAGQWPRAEALCQQWVPTMARSTSSEEERSHAATWASVHEAALLSAARSGDGHAVWHRWLQRRQYTSAPLPREGGLQLHVVNSLLTAQLVTEANVVLSAYCSPCCRGSRAAPREGTTPTVAIGMTALDMYHAVSYHGKQPARLLADALPTVPHADRETAYLVWTCTTAVATAVRSDQQGPGPMEGALSVLDVVRQLVQSEAERHYYPSTAAVATEVLRPLQALASWILHWGLPRLLAGLTPPDITTEEEGGSASPGPWDTLGGELQELVTYFLPVVAATADETALAAWADLFRRWRGSAGVGPLLALQLTEYRLRHRDPGASTHTTVPTSAPSVPLSLIRVAHQGVCLTIDEWRVVYHALQRCPVAEHHTAPWCQSLCQAAHNLAALGDTSTALMAAEAAYCGRLYRPPPGPDAASTPRRHGNGGTQAATTSAMHTITAGAALQYVLDTLHQQAARRAEQLATDEPIDTVRSPRETLEAHLRIHDGAACAVLVRQACQIHRNPTAPLSAAYASLLQSDVLCRVLRLVAAHAPWRETRSLWAEVWTTVPYADWRPHAVPLANCSEVLLGQMLAQGARPVPMLELLQGSWQHTGVAPSPASVATVVTALCGCTDLTQAERRSAASILRQLRRDAGERRMVQILSSLQSASLDPTLLAPVSHKRHRQPALMPSTPDVPLMGQPLQLSEADIDALAVIAPLVHTASPGQLEHLSQRYLDGRLKPYELRAALSEYHRRVVELLDRADDRVDEAVIAYLSRNTVLLVRLSQLLSSAPPPRADGVVEEDFPQRVRMEVFAGYLSAAGARTLWATCEGAARRLHHLRWSPVAEYELCEAARSRQGCPPKFLTTAPELTPHHIAHYWSVFRVILVPEMTLDGPTWCCLAAYAPHVAAIRERSGAAASPAARRAELYELASIVHRTHFAGAAGSILCHSRQPGTAAAVAPQCLPIPLWVIDSVFSIAFKSLQKLHGELQRDAKTRRYYLHCYSGLHTAAQTLVEAQSQPAVDRLDLVLSLLRLQLRLGGSSTPADPTATLQALAMAAYADGTDDGSSYHRGQRDEAAPTWQARTHDGYVALTGMPPPPLVLEAVLRTTPLHKQQAPATTTALTADVDRIQDPELRAVVRVILSHAAVGADVPPTASMALVEYYRRARRDSTHHIVSDLLVAWTALRGRSQLRSLAWQYMDRHHQLSLQRLVCPTVQQVALLPTKHGQGEAAKTE